MHLWSCVTGSCTQAACYAPSTLRLSAAARRSIQSALLRCCSANIATQTAAYPISMPPLLLLLLLLLAVPAPARAAAAPAAAAPPWDAAQLCAAFAALKRGVEEGRVADRSVARLAVPAFLRATAAAAAGSSSSSTSSSAAALAGVGAARLAALNATFWRDLDFDARAPHFASRRHGVAPDCAGCRRGRFLDIYTRQWVRGGIPSLPALCPGPLCGQSAAPPCTRTTWRLALNPWPSAAPSNPPSRSPRATTASPRRARCGSSDTRSPRRPARRARRCGTQATPPAAAAAAVAATTAGGGARSARALHFAGRQTPPRRRRKSVS